jgi:hypothetical protein
LTKAKSFYKVASTLKQEVRKNKQLKQKGELKMSNSTNLDPTQYRHYTRPGKPIEYVERYYRPSLKDEFIEDFYYKYNTFGTLVCGEDGEKVPAVASGPNPEEGTAMTVWTEYGTPELLGCKYDFGKMKWKKNKED